MTKQKQLSILNAPVNKSVTAPALSKTYINPLTGSLLVEPAVNFNELFRSITVKYGTDQAELNIKINSPINSRDLNATFYPITPTISFQTAIPDYSRFTLFFSFTEDFEKFVTMENIAFYPATTQQGTTVNAFTESAKLSGTDYRSALQRLFAKYTLEEYLATLPNSSVDYNSNDFDAKVTHFFERAEFTQVYLKIQLASEKASAVSSYELAATPAVGTIGIGITDISTRIRYVENYSGLYDIYRKTISTGIKSLTYEIIVYTQNNSGTSGGRRYLRTVYPDSSGVASFNASFLEYSRLTDFTDSPLESTTSAHIVDLASFVTTYGVSVDFSLYPIGSEERIALLSRFIPSPFTTYSRQIGSRGPQFVGKQKQLVPYLINNLNKTNPTFQFKGTLYGSVDYAGILPIVSYRTDVPTVPDGLFSVPIKLTTKNQVYRNNLVASGIYSYFNASTESPYLNFTPLSYRQDNGFVNLVGFDFTLPLSKYPDLINGFTELAYYKRTLSLTTETSPAVTFTPDLTNFTVVKGVIPQLALKTGTLTKAKTTITVKKDAAKTINHYLPECVVYLRRYKYQKVGATTTYVADSVLAEGVLRKNFDGTVLITDTSGNTLTYTGNGLIAKDQVRLLADFKNLQDFYGIRNTLSLCDVKDYVEIARITV